MKSGDQASVGSTRPVALVPRFDSIPVALRERPCWVVWRYVRQSEKWGKPPFNARTGKRASSTNPATWSSFAAAAAAYRQEGWDGIGIALEPPVVAIDLDGVLDQATGSVLSDEVAQIIRVVDSYTERSPGGDGLRIFAFGGLPRGRRKTKTPGIQSLEMYSEARYVTVTGHHVPGMSASVNERAGELMVLHRMVFGTGAPSSHRGLDTISLLDTDEEIITRLRRAANGAKFSRLFDLGAPHGEDRSALDQSLCNMVAFYTSDAEQIDRIFRQSALMRAKWGERHYADGRTYGQETIRKALAGLPGSPPPSRRAAALDEIVAIRSAALERRWSPRSADRRVLWVLLDIATRLSKLTVGADVRSLAADAQVAPPTVSRCLRRLWKAGWLYPARPCNRTLAVAAEWALGVPSPLDAQVQQPTTRLSPVDRTVALVHPHDVWEAARTGGLGHAAEQVWKALDLVVPRSAKALAGFESVGCRPRTVRKHLQLLAQYGLAEFRDGGWCRGGAGLDAVARERGTAGAVAARRERFDDDRLRFRKWTTPRRGDRGSP